MRVVCLPALDLRGKATEVRFQEMILDEVYPQRFKKRSQHDKHYANNLFIRN